MKSKASVVFDALVSIALVILIGVVVVEFITDIITQTKIRNKIKEPEKCLIINGKYYCEVEK